ncbi:hypothetical protein [Bacillus massiliglaciei]|uniref:hypothetical protein n=1 Tax=Bacillus massiliglaciei TaxID=1816693 RepID=UPI000DA63C8D|nr:hypothetical protein [Bacillus massiliglaciei]
MGYIAPVTNFSYIHYANRTEEAGLKKRQVDETAPIFQAYLLKKEEELFGKAHAWADQLRKKEKKRAAYSWTKKNKVYVSEETVAAVTGKGLNFNDAI